MTLLLITQVLALNASNKPADAADNSYVIAAATLQASFSAQPSETPVFVPGPSYHSILGPQ